MDTQNSPHISKKRSISDIVWDLASPVAKSLGYSLWDVDYVKEGADYILRITIDTEREGGIGIEDCEAMTRAISDLLDETDPIEDAYLLEVSSPGIERTLSRPEHFAQYTGQRVTARLYTPIEGARLYDGVLLSRGEDGTVTLDLGEKTVTLPKKAISKIETWYDWDGE